MNWICAVCRRGDDGNTDNEPNKNDKDEGNKLVNGNYCNVCSESRFCDRTLGCKQHSACSCNCDTQELAAE